jgi:2'-5' RNA ligase
VTSKRIFFALWPEQGQRERLRDLIGPAVRELEGQAVDRSNWHITLAFIGDLDVRFIPGLIDKAREITFEPFRLRLDRLEFWPRPKIAAVVPPRVPDAMDALVSRLHVLMLDVGVTPAERVYRPHITVVRRARPFEPIRLAHSAETEWSSFELLESVSEHGRTRYRPLLNDF